MTEPITVGMLRHELDKYSDDTIIIVSSDYERNNFNVVYDLPSKIRLKEISDRLYNCFFEDLVHKKLLLIN